MLRRASCLAACGVVLSGRDGVRPKMVVLSMSVWLGQTVPVPVRVGVLGYARSLFVLFMNGSGGEVGCIHTVCGGRTREKSWRNACSSLSPGPEQPSWVVPHWTLSSWAVRKSCYRGPKIPNITNLDSTPERLFDPLEIMETLIAGCASRACSRPESLFKLVARSLEGTSF